MTIILVIITSLLAVLAQPEQVLAQGFQIQVTENGSQSENTVTLETEQSIQLEQDSNSTTTNDISVDQNTGENEANANTGDTSIETGDASSEVAINNQINQNQAEVEKHNPEIEVLVTGNGESSSNETDIVINQSTTVVVDQQATITNTITGIANTGNNTASHNEGQVSISTGSIKANLQVKNISNQAQVNLQDCCQLPGKVKVAGNASDSKTVVAVTLNQKSDLTLEQEATVNNNISYIADSGGNTAEGNGDSVEITTGDIKITVDVDEISNLSETSIGGRGYDACDEEEQTDTENQDATAEQDNQDDPGDPPALPPIGGSNESVSSSSSNSSNSDSSSSDGSVLGASDEHMLPATGSSLLMWLIANILMFLLGCYLRLRSGRSPGIHAQV